MQDLKLFSKFTKQMLDAEEMKAVEINAEHLGLAKIQMMESKGKALADFVNERFRSARKLLVLCDNGESGGMGFVAARHLASKHDVIVGLLRGEEKIEDPPTLINLKLLESSGVEIIEDTENLNKMIKAADLVIAAWDARKYDGKEAVEAVNRAEKEVIAIDSSVDTPGDHKNTIKAGYIVTFHKMKKWLLNHTKTNRIECSDIGIPIEAEVYTGPGDLWMAMPKKNLFDNKLSYGRVLIIGGSWEFHGAPVMSANAAYNTLAALRAGAGYVVLLVPNKLINVARKISPNLIVKGAGEEYIEDFESVKHEIDKSNVIGIGMGIGRKDSTLNAIKKIVKYSVSKNKRIIIDADALYALKRTALSKEAVVTPQEKEFEAIYGEKPDSSLEIRTRQAMELANKLNSIVILKGHITIITDGKIIKLNKTQTAALATMGTGDVLTGITAGFATNNKQQMFDIAAGAVYLHGLIGDMLAKEKGPYILASDLVDRIPIALSQYAGE